MHPVAEYFNALHASLGAGTPETSGYPALAKGFVNIHLNATTRWKGVPEGVWKYTLGGYEALKRWLSYREEALPGRPLASDETQQLTHHVRRITTILVLHPDLDTHYRATNEAPFQ